MLFAAATGEAAQMAKSNAAPIPKTVLKMPDEQSKSGVR